VIATLCKYFGGILQDVKNRVEAFECRLNHFRARLTTVEKGFFSLFQRIRDLEMAVRINSQERQQLRAQNLELEMYLRGYVPSNVHVKRAYRKMIADVPVGDLAFLIQCWMKATDIQSDLHNMSLNRNAQLVKSLAASDMARQTTYSLDHYPSQLSVAPTSTASDRNDGVRPHVPQD
jgi:hypothetical protein